MNIFKLALVATIMLPCGVIADSKVEYNHSESTARQYCLSDKECFDIVSMELDSYYRQGINESGSTSIGTHINRKDKKLADYCKHADNKKSCIDYKNQLMLKYITGLLDR